MRPKLAFYETWPAIALSYFLCLGLPIAPLLLWRRLGKDLTPRPVLAVLLLGGGLFGAGFFLLLMVVPSQREPSAEVYAFFVLALLGHAWMIALGIAAWQNARRIDRYAELLAAHAPTTLDELAAKMGRLDVQNLVTELQTIFDSGALAAYRLDAGTRYVERVAANDPDAAGPAQEIAFVCPSCGATNEGVAVVGGVARCAYCEGVVRG